MHYTNNQPIYEKIRSIPLWMLLHLNSKALKEIELEIKKELRRAKLALLWIQGVKRIKSTVKDGNCNGGYNG